MKVLKAAIDAMESGRPAALVTVIDVSGSTPRGSSTRMLVFDDGSIVGTVGGGAFEFKVIESAIQSIKSGRPTRYSVHLTHDLGMCCGGAMEAYIEPLEKTVELVIYGAGHVGTALAQFAQASGFQVTVVDEREEFADADRFPSSVRVVNQNPLRSLATLPWGEDAFHLIVTHSHQLDQDLVEQILPKTTAWVGMIGSRVKVAKFSLRLRAAGMDESLFERLSAPVGLNIGAETPEEIAVSILAELIRVRRKSTDSPLPLSNPETKSTDTLDSGNGPTQSSIITD
ncbi:MAG: xanthine dehydrogenase accessory protein XdhC [Myxococcota bacterium]